MDANTPATQSFPESDSIDDTKIQDGVSTPQAGVSTPQAGVSKPVRPKGPNATAMVLGLVALVLAAAIIAGETMDLQVDWSRLGPGAIVGIGVLFVVLGAIGLFRRHDHT
jgi:hypothetical protein